MNKEKISSQEIIDLVSSKSSVSKRVAEEFLKVMISSIEEALLAGEVVKIKNFGTFKLLWNEPRKSVNVQTGDDILLSGYHKVSFTPDTILRDLVNEPFAHLLPVELDSENPEPIQEKTDVALDPLRIFTDQAAEIKDLLSEIQALSSVGDSKILKEESEPVLPVESTVVAEDVYKLIQEESVVEHIQEEQVAVQIPNEVTEPVQTQKEAEPIQESPVEFVYEEKQQKSIVTEIDKQQPVDSVVSIHEERQFNDESKSGQSVNSISELDSMEFLKDIKPRRKRKVWLLIVIVIAVIVGLSAGLYLFCPPVTDFTNSSIEKVGKITDNVVASVANLFHTKPKQTPPVARTIIVPKDTMVNDSVDDEVAVVEKESVDSLQVMFDNPRVYTKFIGSEIVKPGNRLTIMSKKYYGNKDFWVYIYEANKENIPNPDRISEGTVIRIPKLDSRLIDVTNPRCIKKAKELHDVYVKNKVN
jgi:nucleoid DNA-binding protein/nucleoid-associated protein YgaU